MKKSCLLVLLVCSYHSIVFSQTLQLIGSAGSEGENATSQLSYSVGELVVASGLAGDGSVTQGYQQSNLVVTGIDEATDEFNLRIYPNPATNLVVLESPNLDQITTISIYDGKGALVKSVGSPQSNRLEIDMSQLSVGTYVLSAAQKKSAQSYTYRIVKTQ